MAFEDLIICLVIGSFTGMCVGLFSIGGGLIIVPVLHVLYPDIAYQDIIIISIHQIFFSSLVSFLTHTKKQSFVPPSRLWLTIHLLALVMVSYLIHLLPSWLLIFVFFVFIILSIIVRCCLFYGSSFKPIKYYTQLSTTLCASIGSMIGLGGSILLYPLLRVSQQNHTIALKNCAWNSFTVGLVGVITHDFLYFFNINKDMPWLMLTVIVLSSISMARVMTLKTYKLSQNFIDQASFLLSVMIIIFYYYFR